MRKKPISSRRFRFVVNLSVVHLRWILNASTALPLPSVLFSPPSFLPRLAALSWSTPAVLEEEDAGARFGADEAANSTRLGVLLLLSLSEDDRGTLGMPSSTRVWNISMISRSPCSEVMSRWRTEGEVALSPRLFSLMAFLSIAQPLFTDLASWLCRAAALAPDNLAGALPSAGGLTT